MVNMERLDALKHEVFDVTPELCSERARLITESYRETKDLAPIIRRARALEYILDKRTLFVRPGELFVGAISSQVAGLESGIPSTRSTSRPSWTRCPRGLWTGSSSARRPRESWSRCSSTGATTRWCRETATYRCFKL